MSNWCIVVHPNLHCMTMQEVNFHNQILMIVFNDLSKMIALLWVDLYSKIVEHMLAINFAPDPPLGSSLSDVIYN